MLPLELRQLIVKHASEDPNALTSAQWQRLEESATTLVRVPTHEGALKLAQGGKRLDRCEVTILYPALHYMDLRLV